jgi:hypothetical protein
MKKDKKRAVVIDLEERVQDIRQKYYEDRDAFNGTDGWDDEEFVDDIDDQIKFMIAEEAMTMFEMCQPGGRFDFSHIEI